MNPVSISIVSPKKDPKQDSTLSVFPNDTHSEAENLSDITEDFGQLFVKVISCSNFDVEPGFLGVYAILTLEKQQHRTATVESTVINRKNTVEWHQEFNFDVTQAEADLTISVWGKYPKNNVVSIGKVSVPAKVFRNEKRGPQTTTLFLRKMNDSARLLKTELTLCINFTRMTKKSVGPNDFEYLAVIGRGSFGKVFQVRKKDSGCIYAMKVIKKENVIKRNAVKHTMAENRILKSLTHPFLVNLKYAFQTKERLYMVIDYLNGGELFYHLSQDDTFSEERARFYAAEVVLALGYLHDNGILYRDLKPENLLLDMHGHICLVDFGLCKDGLGIGTKTHTFCGSPEYIAPEVLRGKGYGKEIDWWALGTLIYEMLTGLPPFWSEDEEVMHTKIQYAPLHLPPELSPEVRDLLKRLLHRKPEERLGTGVDGTEQVKKHPWFASIDWRKCYLKELEPPFKPHVTSQLDLNYFDEEFTRENPRFSYTTPIDDDIFLGFSYDGRPEFKPFELRNSKQRINIAHERRRRFSSHSSSSSTGSFSTIIKKEDESTANAVTATASPEASRANVFPQPSRCHDPVSLVASNNNSNVDSKIKATEVVNNNQIAIESIPQNEKTQIIRSDQIQSQYNITKEESAPSKFFPIRNEKTDTLNKPKISLAPIVEHPNENVHSNVTNYKRDNEPKTPRSNNSANTNQNENEVKKPRTSNPNSNNPTENEPKTSRSNNSADSNVNENEVKKPRTSNPNSNNPTDNEPKTPRSNNSANTNVNENELKKPQMSNPNSSNQTKNETKMLRSNNPVNVNQNENEVRKPQTNIPASNINKRVNELKTPRSGLTTNLNTNEKELKMRTNENSNFKFVQVKPKFSERRMFLIGNKKTNNTNVNTNRNNTNTPNTNTAMSPSDDDLDSEFELSPICPPDSVVLMFPLDQ
jgi:serine/threonine protein kinase